MKPLFPLFLLTIFGLTGFAQTPGVVTDLSWEFKRTDEKVHIEYTLNKQGNTTYYDVSFQATFFGVEIPITSDAVTGDYGRRIRWGKKKTIVWDVYKNAAQVDLAGEIVVLATPDMNPDIEIVKECPNTDYYIAGAGLAVGGGFIIYGATSLFSSDIKRYKEDCDPDADTSIEGMFLIDPITGESLCDEAYDRANKKYKRGQVFSGLGLIAAGVGTYFLAKKPILIKCESQNSGDGNNGSSNFFSIVPQGGLNGIHPNGIPELTVGWKVSYHF